MSTASTVMNFHDIKKAIAKKFKSMTKSNKPLFVTAAGKDEMWEAYLNAFPEGSNPMFRERTEHDCQCCKQFIRVLGNAVIVKNNELVSIWDIKVDNPNYQAVANSMASFVKSHPIKDVFYHYEATAGRDRNFAETVTGVETFHHFFVNLPSALTLRKADIPTKQSEHRDDFSVLNRSLKEISLEACDTVLELIAANSLYRGAEHKVSVANFKKLKNEFNLVSTNLRENFVWQNCFKTKNLTRIRNTAIGTLLVDISSDIDLDTAVRSFESKVAPTNYKRPTAVVSKAMINKARETIEELGLTSALHRRYAELTDINVNNILWADRNAKKAMDGDVFDDLLDSTKDKAPKNLGKVTEISIDKFIEDVLPKAEGLEIMVTNDHHANFVSLITAVDDTANKLFKWSNSFSWAYNGDLADSLKERVKKAGGAIDADLCCRLAWYNKDDLDLHMYEDTTKGSPHICYSTKTLPNTSGQLDVDMNAGAGNAVRDPVENIFYKDRNKMHEGVYTLKVHNFAKRESIDVGFEVEFDYLGKIHKFVYDKPVKNKEYVEVVKFKFSKKDGIEILSSLPSSEKSRSVWGITTQSFRKVNVVMFSPNFWDGQVGIGNKHFFFMLDGCKRDTPARGFFNEFLRSDLDKHRKVIEIVGSKMTTAESTDQLSGIGFSSTKRAEILVRVSGSFTRLMKITF